MLGCKHASTSIDPNVKLTLESGELLDDPSMYQRLIGRLIYLTNTRPALTFAVSVVNQFMHAPCSRIDWRSTFGFCTFYGDYLISWKSKKQAVISKSSAKVEYWAMTYGTWELING
ncbi:uncharacterized protein LOC114311818 [Camellia sinensis]|uniref:uncharacterized protein LOC114311818 n=1 Tax=Camellia sinensis TaxID=4442 RepID=UPI0010365069|nr:uncharacterized protein LOC114311818 [Camellia sinensis]